MDDRAITPGSNDNGSLSTEKSGQRIQHSVFSENVVGTASDFPNRACPGKLELHAEISQS